MFIINCFYAWSDCVCLNVLVRMTVNGDTTFSITTFIIRTLIITTFSIPKYKSWHSIMTFSIMPFDIVLLRWVSIMPNGLCRVSFMLNIAISHLWHVYFMLNVFYAVSQITPLCWMSLCWMPLCWMSWRPVDSSATSKQGRPSAILSKRSTTNIGKHLNI